MADISELETKVALLGEYKAYSSRSARENIDYLVEHERKRELLLAESGNIAAKLNAYLPILKQCSQR